MDSKRRPTLLLLLLLVFSHEKHPLNHISFSIFRLFFLFAHRLRSCVCSSIDFCSIILWKCPDLRGKQILEKMWVYRCWGRLPCRIISAISFSSHSHSYSSSFFRRDILSKSENPQTQFRMIISLNAGTHAHPIQTAHRANADRKYSYNQIIESKSWHCIIRSATVDVRRGCS